MNVDPYNLDSTNFAQGIAAIDANTDWDNIPEEPPHPLRENVHLTALCDHLSATQQELFRIRRPNGEMGDDAYFHLTEGTVLRPEILARLYIDYVRQHPEILNE